MELWRESIYMCMGEIIGRKNGCKKASVYAASLAISSVVRTVFHPVQLVHSRAFPCNGIEFGYGDVQREKTKSHYSCR